jgi:hypothetical protein
MWQMPVAWDPGKKRRRAFITAIVVAIAIEFVQAWVGRQASMTDTLNGVAGAFLATLAAWLWPRGFGWRLVVTLYTAWICAGVILPAWRLWEGIRWRKSAFPMIADFEESAEFQLWRATMPFDNPYASDIGPSFRGIRIGALMKRSPSISSIPRNRLS